MTERARWPVREELEALPAEPGGRHPTAVIDPDAEIPDSVTVGPFSVIGPGVVVGEGTTIGPHVLVERNTRIGAACELHKGAVLGTDPQDQKYEGEDSNLVVGPRTVIREYATLNRGTAASGTTTVGADSLVMAYSHVAHDCHLGEHVVLANAVHMGGHVQIGDWTIVGGISGIHQFVRIGRHAFVGGGTRLTQDVAPYLTVAGNPCTAYGLNRTGLRRRGFTEEAIRALRAAYRKIFQSDRNIGEALRELEAEDSLRPEVRELVEFIRNSERGITT